MIEMVEIIFILALSMTTVTIFNLIAAEAMPSIIKRLRLWVKYTWGILNLLLIITLFFI